MLERRAAATLRGAEHEINIACSIWPGLPLKEPPRLQRFDVAGMSRPATQTAGGFHDWQPFPGGRAIIAIADVTRQGIGPALVMAIRRAITPTAQGADQSLNSINELSSRDLTKGPPSQRPLWSPAERRG